ncbi:response regulator [Larkinella arboricola]|nr:response regulator [Larkinella arboricola]
MKKDITILIIEDDAFHQKLLTYQLTKHGYRVSTAHDGQQALAGLQSGVYVPDLILMDMQLPRLSGLEVLRALKNSAFASPVILMSAAEWPWSHQDLDQPDAFLLKPLRMEKLLDTLELLLRPAVIEHDAYTEFRK